MYVRDREPTIKIRDTRIWYNVFMNQAGNVLQIFEAQIKPLYSVHYRDDIMVMAVYASNTHLAEKRAIKKFSGYEWGKRYVFK